MYHYYQKKEHGKWLLLPEDQATPDRLAELKAKKVTILAVNQEVDEFTDKNELSYKGPLYFDIDCKEDVYEAIKSCRALVAKLLSLDLDPDAVQVYCSGSKGLHVVVDQRAFSTARPVKNLPLVYKEMAKTLYVFGLDYQVYSQGRGVSWRLADVERDDGRYRVRITLDELDTLTVEDYARLTEAPRNGQIDWPDPAFENKHAYRLMALFDRAKEEVKGLKKKRQQTAKVSKQEEEIMSALKGQVPQCVTDLVDGKTDESKNLNEIALQLAAYTVASGMEDGPAKELFGKFAETSDSSQYSTTRERYEHATGLRKYLSSGTRTFSFSCGAICSVLSTKPCKECPVTATGRTESSTRSVDEGGGVEEWLAEEIDIAVRYDGYYAVMGEAERKLSTFTMEVTDYHEEPTQDGTGSRITGYIVKLRTEIDGRMEYREVPVSEEGFTSRAALNNELRGIPGAIFYGSDTDAIKLKAFITSREMRDKANKIITSFTAGIVSHKIGSTYLHVYVDPDGSINEFKVQGTHYLNSDLIAPPEFFTVGVPRHGDPEVNEVLGNLLEINDPLVVASLLGWHTAVHFKSHIMLKHNQFPLLSMWGPAGVGKTMTAVKFCFLNGCDFKTKSTPIITSNSTPWALVDYCSTTSTVPRILDEANESKMERRLYEKFAEVVKASFNGSTMPRGTINRTGSSGRGRTGAKTVSIPISSPLVMLSEQSQTMPAIQQRTLDVLLTNKGRHGRREHFRSLVGKEKVLMSLGKAMMFRALGTPSEQICSMVEKYVPMIDQDMDDRTIFSYAVTLAGLEMLALIVDELGLDHYQRIEELRSMLLEHINVSKRAEIMQAKQRTEIDAVLEIMASMAQMTASGQQHNALMEDIHFVVREGTDLLIDYKTAFPQYMNFCRRSGIPIIIRTLGNFLTLIREEPYYIDEEPPGIRCRRPMIVLDTRKLHDKGIDPTLFSEEAVVA